MMFFILVAVLCFSLSISIVSSQAVPTFVGIRTFMGAPYITDLDALKAADFAVLGVPFDEGTWGWMGARFGPRNLRESSQEYHHDLTEGFYYIDGNRVVLKGKHWADVGDVPLMPTVPEHTNLQITQMVSKIRSKGAFPIVLGGDHSITFPVLRAFTDCPLTVIHFDAHLDTWDGAPGGFDHASWVNRAVGLSQVKKVIQLGMRGLANDLEAVENAIKDNTTIFTGEQIHREGVEHILSQIPSSTNIYITFDVDVMDPSIAPGTGTIEPDGLSFAEIQGLLKGVASKGKLVGMDIVEINPVRDTSTRTEQTAIRLLIDTLGAAFH
eukprot:TRINITY_DN2508_c0_g1_i1.p1 TRINITY_DN2508_c0_g1~~TRINITY_DN2508_c0_g1_i1.p1  ORF type:complete len:325 (+),score=67.46 TRINITY_DN2508_c0_g1_i1:84-1058(+)